MCMCVYTCVCVCVCVCTRVCVCVCVQGLTLASDIGHLTDKICKCPIDVSYKRTNVLLICCKGDHIFVYQDIVSVCVCVCVCVSVCVCVFEILV